MRMKYMLSCQLWMESNLLDGECKIVVNISDEGCILCFLWSGFDRLYTGHFTIAIWTWECGHYWSWRPGYNRLHTFYFTINGDLKVSLWMLLVMKALMWRTSTLVTLQWRFGCEIGYYGWWRLCWLDLTKKSRTKLWFDHNVNGITHCIGHLLWPIRWPKLYIFNLASSSLGRCCDCCYKWLMR